MSIHRTSSLEMDRGAGVRLGGSGGAVGRMGEGVGVIVGRSVGEAEGVDVGKGVGERVEEGEGVEVEVDVGVVVAVAVAVAVGREVGASAADTGAFSISGQTTVAPMRTTSKPKMIQKKPGLVTSLT
jgi:hypothetical protein